jgi:hypothetical protein
MKLKFIAVVLLGLKSYSFAQKVDLDKAKFNVSYQALPKENVSPEKRTFSTSSTAGVMIKSFVDEAIINQKLNISGWKKVEKDALVQINLELIDFRFISSKINEEVTENKDKDGKVTSKTRSYYVTAEYEQTGRLKVYGPFSPEELTEKEKEAQKAKEEKVASNRFLAKTSLTTGSTPSTDVNMKSENLGRYRTYTSEKFESSTKASDYFRTSQEAIRENLLRDFVNNSIDRANNFSNFYFGFPTARNNSDYLWILDSKSHPEYQTQQEAIQAVKALFANMKANEPIDKLREDMQPLIDYFESLKTKYKADDKNERKIRYGAFFNLANIYYYLDLPTLAIIQAEGLIANDYDKKDGENLKKDAQELSDLFKKTKFTSRHNPEIK